MPTYAGRGHEGPPNRADVSLRLKGLTPEQAEQVAQALAPLARQFGGTLNITDLVMPEGADYAVQLGRRKIV
jgi:hypothetical protein